MKRIIFPLILLIISSTVVYATDTSDDQAYDVYISSLRIKMGDTFDWENKGPIDLLELLKQKDNVPWYRTINSVTFSSFSPRSFTFWQYTVVQAPKNWISVDDIPQLIKLLNSKTPCASVAMTISSYYSDKASTIGHEAAFLIEGFRKGRYPSELNSIHWKADKKEIKQWWEDYKKQNLTIKETVKKSV
jgi:hypothetical protein